jgi:hypothetical protein
MSWIFSSLQKTLSPAQQLQSELCKIDRPISSNAILLGVLKSIEKELRARGFLGDSFQEAMPLWFLAETERNIFLWRSCLSIDDANEFSFWVDVPALIAKRRRHLSRCDGFNPFVNPSPRETGAEMELRYLDHLEDLGESVLAKAAVISRASHDLRRHLEPSSPICPTIVLPYVANQL